MINWHSLLAHQRVLFAFAVGFHRPLAAVTTTVSCVFHSLFFQERKRKKSSNNDKEEEQQVDGGGIAPAGRGEILATAF